MLLAAGLWVVLVDFINLRGVGDTDRPTALSTMPMPQSWGGYAWRELSRLAGDTAFLEPVLAQNVLESAARRYPLDAEQWLDLAQIHVDANRPDRVRTALDKALASQTENREALWRAAQIALQTNRPDIAERQFRRWLQQFPNDVERALFIGSRWIPEAGELVDRMLPEGRAYLVEAMRVAERQRDTELALAVWERLEPKPGLDDAEFVDFVEQLLVSGRVDQAVSLWAEQDPAFQPGGIANGDFSRALGHPGGLNWVTRFAPASVRIERDLDVHTSAPASLRIRFNGKENINLARPTVRIPVESSRRYRLSGMWRAEGLTTRSLPFFSLNIIRGEALRVPGRNFEWEPWEFEFDVPEGTRLVQLTLRRGPTDAFDRNIGGRLWLDDFQLAPIDEPVELEGAVAGDE